MSFTIALFCYKPLNSVCGLCPSEPYLFEKVEQPEFAKKAVGTELGSLLSLPGVCTHSYLSGLDFMTHITENNSELKPTLLLDMLRF